MNWDDLTFAWRSQPPETISETTFDAMKNRFEKKSRRLKHTLFRRDALEVACGLFVIYIFANATFHRAPAWLLWLALLPLVGVVTILLKERIRAHRTQPDPNASFLERVDADLAELQHQTTILNNIVTWYLGPIALSWFLVMVGTGFHGLGGHLRTPRQIIVYFICCVILMWLVWHLNHRAVQKCITPKITELEQLKNELMLKS
jgi:hypothetical protein